jgi:hypothetical protein
MNQNREGWALPAAGRHPEIQMRKFGWCQRLAHPPVRDAAEDWGVSERRLGVIKFPLAVISAL